MFKRYQLMLWTAFSRDKNMMITQLLGCAKTTVVFGESFRNQNKQRERIKSGTANNPIATMRKQMWNVESENLVVKQQNLPHLVSV